MRRASLIVRMIWATCLLIGAANHVRILLRHGLFWDYGGVCEASAIFWTSLTFLDPLVAALLFLRPKAGIVCTAVLIATNVIHNTAISARYDRDGDFLAHAMLKPYLASQVGFMLFVAATARLAWRGLARGVDPMRTGDSSVNV